MYTQYVYTYTLMVWLHYIHALLHKSAPTRCKRVEFGWTLCTLIYIAGIYTQDTDSSIYIYSDLLQCGQHHPFARRILAHCHVAQLFTNEQPRYPIWLTNTTNVKQLDEKCAVQNMSMPFLTTAANLWIKLGTLGRIEKSGTDYDLKI